MLNWIKKIFHAKKPIELAPVELTDKEKLLQHVLKTQDILEAVMPRAKAQELLQRDLISMIKAKKDKLGAARVNRG